MVSIKSPKELAIMGQNGKILAEIVKQLSQMIQPGRRTRELDKVARDLILKYGGKPSFLGYQGFPAALCVSVNEEIVHGVPSGRELKEGDIVSLDLGFFKEGFHADMAVTLPVGKVEPEAQRLIRVTKKALKRGIKKARAGNTVGDIGNTIQRYVESQGFSVVRDLCGHGIGRELHEEPQILNYGKRHKGEKLRENMVICLEPMVSAGAGEIKKGEDGFSYVTKDNALSAHFEHMVVVTREGCKVLTKVR